MRRTFTEILDSREVDLKTEYRRLYILVYEEDFNRVMEATFNEMPFRGTAIDLDDFERECGLTFYITPDEVSLDALLGFMEYVYNYAHCIAGSAGWTSVGYRSCAQRILIHVEAVAEKLDCEFRSDGEYLILIERDDEAWSAAEVAPESVVEDLINYSYRGLAGDLKAKREKLNNLLLELEPKRQALSAVSKCLSNDLFNMANNLHVRHNNVSKENGNEEVAKMNPKELEEKYDELHRLCIAAFILLDHELESTWRNRLCRHP